MKSINRRSNLIKAFVISLLIPLFVGGCKTKEDSDDYHGTYPDLYSVAIDSLLGIRGRSSDDRDHEIEITSIERDKYGRHLYLYYEGSDVSRYSLLISQRRNSENFNEYTYYYPDYNFISAPENSFSEEEIEELKRKNDWNEKLNLDKCKKIDIIRKKKEGSVKKGKLRELYWKALGEDAYGYTTARFFTTDDYGRSLYLGYGRGTSNRRYAVMLFNPDSSYDESKCVLELTDAYHYQDELKEFKELNDWNQPLEE